MVELVEKRYVKQKSLSQDLKTVTEEVSRTV